MRAEGFANAQSVATATANKMLFIDCCGWLFSDHGRRWHPAQAVGGSSALLHAISTTSFHLHPKAEANHVGFHPHIRPQGMPVS